MDLRPRTNIKGGSLKQDFFLDRRLDIRLYDEVKDVIDGKRERVTLDVTVTNEDRTFGATLSNYISLCVKIF